MIKVTFPDADTERQALAFLAGRFPFKTYADGSTLVPEPALSRLAGEGIAFTVEGRAPYEQTISTVRDSSTPAVQ